MSIKSAQDKIHGILWNDVASGDVAYVLRDIVEEFVNEGFPEIAKQIKRAVRHVKVD